MTKSLAGSDLIRAKGGLLPAAGNPELMGTLVTAGMPTPSAAASVPDSIESLAAETSGGGCHTDPKPCCPAPRDDRGVAPTVGTPPTGPFSRATGGGADRKLPLPPPRR